MALLDPPSVTTAVKVSVAPADKLLEAAESAMLEGLAVGGLGSVTILPSPQAVRVPRATQSRRPDGRTRQERKERIRRMGSKPSRKTEPRAKLATFRLPYAGRLGCEGWAVATMAADAVWRAVVEMVSVLVAEPLEESATVGGFNAQVGIKVGVPGPLYLTLQPMVALPL